MWLELKWVEMALEQAAGAILRESLLLVMFSSDLSSA